MNGDQFRRAYRRARAEREADKRRDMQRRRPRTVDDGKGYRRDADRQ